MRYHIYSYQYKREPRFKKEKRTFCATGLTPDEANERASQEMRKVLNEEDWYRVSFYAVPSKEEDPEAYITGYHPWLGGLDHPRATVKFCEYSRASDIFWGAFLDGLQAHMSREESHDLIAATWLRHTFDGEPGDSLEKFGREMGKRLGPGGKAWMDRLKREGRW